MEYKWEAGQKVIQRTRFYQSVETIERVTPTGLAVIRSSKYKRDGNLMGLGKWDMDYIVPATEEEIKEVIKQNVISRVIGEWKLMD